MSARDRPATIQAIEICYGEEGLRRLHEGLCPMCGSNNKEFRDEVSRIEHDEISQLCQECQDKSFGKEETDI